jgi:hypothetical protein
MGKTAALAAARAQASQLLNMRGAWYFIYAVDAAASAWASTTPAPYKVAQQTRREWIASRMRDLMKGGDHGLSHE